MSDELIDELQETITKPKLRKYFRGDGLSDLLNAFDPFVDFIEMRSTVIKCRDPKDDFLLALAKDGKADYLLTGDADLLEIEKYGKTVISTMALFLSTHGTDS